MTTQSDYRPAATPEQVDLVYALRLLAETIPPMRVMLRLASCASEPVVARQYRSRIDAYGVKG